MSKETSPAISSAAKALAAKAEDAGGRGSGARNATQTEGKKGNGAQKLKQKKK